MGGSSWLLTGSKASSFPVDEQGLVNRSLEGCTCEQSNQVKHMTLHFFINKCFRHTVQKYQVEIKNRLALL